MEVRFNKNIVEFRDTILLLGFLKQLVKKGEIKSNSYAKRLLKQGAIKVNEKVVKEEKHQLKDRDIIQYGKRKFIKLKVPILFHAEAFEKTGKSKLKPVNLPLDITDILNESNASRRKSVD